MKSINEILKKTCEKYPSIPKFLFYKELKKINLTDKEINDLEYKLKNDGIVYEPMVGVLTIIK